MMKKRLYLRLLLAIFAFMVSLPMFAHDIEAKNADGVTIYYVWWNSYKTELAVSFRGSVWMEGRGSYSGDVVIPESVEYDGKTYSVTTIASWAFWGCDLTSVTIPNSVTTIWENAFECCGLTSITIPNSVTRIGSEAFYDCGRLTSITISNSVTSISSTAFSDTEWYGNQPDGLIYLGKIAYKYKGEMPVNTRIGIKDGTQVIASGAFSGCSGLTSITIPNSVTSIGSSAFWNCSGLTSITIPNSVTSIGDYAFDGTGWYNNQPSGLVYAGKVAYKYKGTMPDNTSLTIKDGTLGIASGAFYGCSGLTSITIPNSVTSIESYAFGGCSGLASIVVESGNIVFDSRDNCNALIVTSSNNLIFGCKNTIIPNSVTSIGDGAFRDCSGLTSVTIPNSVTSIDNSAFYGCSGLTSVSIPNGVTSIGNYAFENCNSLISVTIPNSVTSIGWRSFEGCSGLKTITSEIEKPFYISWAFSDDTYNVAELIVPKGTKNLYQATEGWNKFNKITEVEDTKTFINNGIYYQLKSDGTLEVTGLSTSTTRADIPSSLTIDGTKYRVTSIGDYAFEGRSDITYLSIQYSIKSIGKYAFRDCGNSMTVNIANLDSWCKMELGNEHSSPLSSAGKVLLYDVETTSINIPETVTSIAKYTFYQCKSITSLSIPGSVTSIGSSAFEDCTGLTSVALSKGLTSIGGSSFEGCKGLTSIKIPSTVTSIALNAFKDCTNLNTITSEIQNPFAIDENVFSTYSTATLTVPAGTKSAYQNTAGWNKFAKISEKSGGVDNPDYPNQYLTFVARERGSFSFNGTSSNNVDNSIIYYSLDGGSSWTALARNVQSPIIQAGNKIMFKGACKPIYYYVEGAEAIIGIGVFTSTGRFDAEGNVMSMLYGDYFIGQTNLTGKDYAFSDLFATCAGLLSADNLVLPATLLSESCYEGMFRSCTSLISTPQLPATTLAKSCYTGMFWGCSSLTFAPQLPALTLDVNCYANMFGFCSSLTTAPILPAKTLSEQCYRSMFNACTNLKEITCLATDISANECTYNWVRNVPSSGTFIKSSSMNSWTRGIDGIPTNWTIHNDDGTKADELTDNGFTFSVDTSSLTAEVISFDQSRSNVSIPETVTYNGTIYRVTSIGNFAFYQCRNITSVTIPSSVTSIGSSAFEDCTGLISITLSKGLTSIGGSSFEGCTGLTSITIPSTVTSIAINAYKNCTGLNTIISEIQNPFAINENVFSTYSTATLNVPAGTKSLYQSTAGWNKFQNIVEASGGDEPKPVYNAPEGYSLVWNDEFDNGSELYAADWTHEVQNSGWVNNQLQNYVNHKTPKGTMVTEVNNGKLRITALKEDGKIYSGRVYAKVKQGWTYGYIEASIKLPKGKGTWPAFWMMPVNFKSWPADGEIDIMEEVGYHPDYVSSSLHANAHVHTNGTQVTHEMKCEGAEGEFHTYAILWTEKNITTYVDGKVQLSYDNRGLGRDDWPYDDPFYIILNLAWGGDWGGAQGVDESVLPATMEVDYIRVFQKTAEGGDNESKVTLTANSYTREYGEDNPLYEYTTSGAALNGTPTISCDATKNSPVGTYAIKITKGSVTNSNVSYVDGTLTITKAPLSVTAKSYSREQGKENPTFEVTYSGFKNGETESVLTQKPTVTTTATANSSPGTYDINVSGAEALNYSFTYYKGVLTVTEKDEVVFSIDGITYSGAKSEKTVKVKSVDKGLVSIEIPASVGYEGTTYQVAGIEEHVFDGCNMGALIWNVETALPNNALSNATIGSNFLIYVKSANYAPSSVKNVVVNGSAQTIMLSDDGGQFYCPQAFTANSISYTHNYSMETGGSGKGWETLVLPFDVQKITHSTRGEIVPFAGYRSGSSQKPFWLGSFSGSGFRRTSAVLANEPYIIAMPNNSSYRNEYNLAGDVTFSADNVQVPKTPSFNGTFLPAYATVAKSSTVYALNVSNRYVKYSGAYDAGSRFISGLRDVLPFEAYMTGSSSTRGVIEINFEDGTTDMDDIFLSTDENLQIIIYTLSGQQVSRTTQRDFDAVWQPLPKGVYIVNGKKMIK